MRGTHKPAHCGEEHDADGYHGHGVVRQITKTWFSFTIYGINLMTEVDANHFTTIVTSSGNYGLLTGIAALGNKRSARSQIPAMGNNAMLLSMLAGK